MEYIDQLHRTISFPKTPSRIISLVPSQTELLVSLGLRSSIVGITKFCVHPNDLRIEKMVVGGTKKVNFKKILALKADIIICNKEENTEEMILQLEKIAPVWISDVKNIPDSLRMIEQLGKIFDVSIPAQELISKINVALSRFQKSIRNYPEKRVLYLIWKNPYMAAGKDTFINSLLEINKFKNCIVEETSRYPEVGIEDFEKAELILLSTEPYPFNQEDVLTIQNEFKIAVRLVDGEYFSWYGSRLTAAFDYFKKLHQI